MREYKNTKRTHFQSRSIPASDKSPCRLSVFFNFTFCPLPFAFLSKRTHFTPLCFSVPSVAKKQRCYLYELRTI